MQEMHKMNFWFDVLERNHFHTCTEEMTWRKMNKCYGCENLSRAITNDWITLHEDEGREVVSFPIHGGMILTLTFTPKITRMYTKHRPEFNISEIKELSCI